MRTCAHIRCVNSAALRLAGIDRNTPDPPGGEIERDENGEPTGVLRESASSLMSPFMPEGDLAQQTANLLELGDHCGGSTGLPPAHGRLLYVGIPGEA